MRLATPGQSKLPRPQRAAYVEHLKLQPLSRCGRQSRLTRVTPWVTEAIRSRQIHCITTLLVKFESSPGHRTLAEVVKIPKRSRLRRCLNKQLYEPWWLHSLPSCHGTGTMDHHGAKIGVTSGTHGNYSIDALSPDSGSVRPAPGGRTGGEST
jgi:hypothetical protein